jgi:hypothetical protein
MYDVAIRVCAERDHLGQSAPGRLDHTPPHGVEPHHKSPVGNEHPMGTYLHSRATAGSQGEPRRGRVAGQLASGTVQRHGEPASHTEPRQVPSG